MKETPKMTYHKARSSRQKSPEKLYKTEKCRVLEYDSKRKTLNVLFRTYGIQLRNVDTCTSEYVDVKYIGEIGQANFSYELVTGA